MTGRPVQCLFRERVPAREGRFRYVPLHLRGPRSAGMLETAWPPQPGDLIILQEDAPEPRDLVYQVVQRCWLHTQYGSGSWPYGTQEPETGPLLQIIVEAAEGLYWDEADEEDITVAPVGG